MPDIINPDLPLELHRRIFLYQVRTHHMVARLPAAFSDFFHAFPEVAAIGYSARTGLPPDACFPFSLWHADETRGLVPITASAGEDMAAALLQLLRDIPPVSLVHLYKGICAKATPAHVDLLHMRHVSFLSWNDLEYGFGLLTGEEPAPPQDRFPRADAVLGLGFTEAPESAHLLAAARPAIAREIALHDRFLSRILDMKIQSRPRFQTQ